MTSTTSTLVLQARNSTFQTKTLELRDKAHLKIGRHTSSKTAPGPFNGYFDSKVLSRTHAEIWNDKGKVYIKDVKSSNGTFLNGRRLSAECEESLPMELKSNDELEFGIDITNDDGSVLYHKVSCEVHIFALPLSQVDSAILKEMSISNGHMEAQLQRKSSTLSVSTVSSSDLSGSITTGKRSKSLELLLTKLQSELRRSQEVENELRTMKETILDVDKTVNEDRLKKADSLNALLQQQVRDAQKQIMAYAEKCRHQDQAIMSAQQELHRVQRSIQNGADESHRRLEELKLSLEEDKLRLRKELAAEKARCLEFEKRCLMLEKRARKLEQEQYRNIRWADILQVPVFQVLLGGMIGVVSILLYLLVAI
ncbi:hypothetical protein EC973_000716 [Apophysomyces ossiformis]|uniref:FHA domain-containing protein n=1 Tax=Apophysomyces ossiformis TaxID=679940 RepID=A0A8H7BN49_9FUNG|nr:hypothetical protein EC973_000716 [Apophysomyces ossiformis]